MTDDETLAANAAAGDLRARNELWTKYYVRMVAFVHSIVMGSVDLASNALIHAINNIGSFTSVRGTFRNWLYSVVRNRALSECRRRKIPVLSSDREGDGFEPVADVPSLEDAPETGLVRFELASIVKAALGTLRDGHLAVVLLVDCEGFKRPEAAEILGIPVGTVDSRLHYAHDCLRNYHSKGGTWLKEYHYER
jgi:RNA polymerase sigma-70 factor (ECF subfamily)